MMGGHRAITDDKLQMTNEKVDVVERRACLEGSRFVILQLYELAAGGSRKLPSAMFCPALFLRLG
jgi:hypothetical protein